MASIYAMSDPHGEREAFEEALALVDLSDPGSQLVLLGDYIDHHRRHPEMLRQVMELQQAYPQQVVVLLGNHDARFLAECGHPLPGDPVLCLPGEDAEGGALSAPADGPAAYDDGEVIRWLRSLPSVFETDDQIFVHAGIDEEAEDLWRWGSEDAFFREKFPPSFGPFAKDIVAGHVGTASLAGDPSFHGVFWDGASHFYLDGSTETSKQVPVLRYDRITRHYTSFRRVANGAGGTGWEEYDVCAEGPRPAV